MEIREVIEKIKQEKYDFSKPETSLNRSDYKEGYNDACDDILDIIFKQLDEPQKVKVKPYVAEWFEKNKDDLEFNIWRYIRNWNEHPKDEFQIFMNNGPSKPIETLIRMQDGYEVEEEPKYQVKLKFGRQYLSKNADGNMLDFYSCMVFPPSFSKKELESIEDGAFYKADGDKEWINPIIELVPVEKV